MNELGLNAADAAKWFKNEIDQSFMLVEVDGAQAKLWAVELQNAVRRCYIADALVAAKVAEHGVAYEEVVASKLPGPGSTMSGDFGEILVYIYQAAKALPTKVIGPKKWRLKQDRTKPAPYSDVL